MQLNSILSQKLVLVTGFLFITLIVPPVYAGNTSAEALLARMAIATRTLSYSGTFTYEDGGGTVEALQIIHRVENGVETEVINHLNGPARKFKLPQLGAGCNKVGSSLLMTVGEEAFKPNQNYVYSLRGKNRIAGRVVDIVRIIPRDEFRYGLTLGLDSETGLLLMAVVMSPQKLLERVQFTSLTIDKNLAETVSGDSDIQPQEQVDCSSVESDQSPLAPQWVPEGFALAAYAYSDDAGHVETYTDGLASFSITVQSREGAAVEALQGEAQRGATIIKLSLLAVDNVPLQVTVVGEIPSVSANRILRSVRPSKLIKNAD